MTEEEKQEEKQSWDGSGFTNRALGSIHQVPPNQTLVYAILAVAYHVHRLTETIKRQEKK